MIVIELVAIDNLISFHFGNGNGLENCIVQGLKIQLFGKSNKRYWSNL